ncbi:MAG: hypothetical protein EOO68_27220, partial [Moraxellaceae bacterium]
MSFDDLACISLNQLTRAENWQAKYRLITDWGKLISNKPDIRQAVNLIRGCETQVWLCHSFEREVVEQPL